MKFIGTPGQLVRITKIKPINRRQIPKTIRFDEDGFYETENKHLIKRLSAKFEAVEEHIEEEQSTEIIELNLDKQEEVLNEEEIRTLAKEAGIKSWHVKSIERLLTEIEELEV